MKILGIDTTTKLLCLGISDNCRQYEYKLELGKKQSALLIPTIKRVLESLGMDIREIDYFACGLGPGSFTGVRVGVAAVKGLSWALKKPVIGISTLDILAKNVEAEGKFIVPCLDAKRGLIYSSIYRQSGDSLKRISPYLLISAEELSEKIRPKSVIFGDAANLYKEKIFARTKGVIILDKDYWYPEARQILELARERLKEKKLQTPFNVKPLYLYPKECQIKKA